MRKDIMEVIWVKNQEGKLKNNRKILERKKIVISLHRI